MTEKLPNWNLGDFYSSIKDEGIDLDLEKYGNFSKSFNKKYKGQLVNQAQKLESIIKEYEDGNELGDKLGNFAFLIYATNMNCLLYTSPSPRDKSSSRMPSSA